MRRFVCPKELWALILNVSHRIKEQCAQLMFNLPLAVTQSHYITLAQGSIVRFLTSDLCNGSSAVIAFIKNGLRSHRPMPL
jgi:hypothetical protein